MIETDSLDHITLDSDDIQTIERFKNNYYNHNKNLLQNGGNDNDNNKLKRLFNCYILSLNQNGGKDNKLSSQIKKKLDKKLKNYYIGEGGVDPLTIGVFLGFAFVTHIIGITVNDILKLIAETDKIGNKITKQEKNKMLKEGIPKILKNNFIDLPNGMINLPQNIINLFYESKPIQQYDQSDQRVNEIIEIIEKDENKHNINSQLTQYFLNLFYPFQNKLPPQQSSSQAPIPPRAQARPQTHTYAHTHAPQQSSSQPPAPPPRAREITLSQYQQSSSRPPQSYQQSPPLAPPRAQSSPPQSYQQSPPRAPLTPLAPLAPLALPRVQQQVQSSPPLPQSQPLLRTQSSPPLYTQLSPQLPRSQPLPHQQYSESVYKLLQSSSRQSSPRQFISSAQKFTSSLQQSSPQQSSPQQSSPRQFTSSPRQFTSPQYVKPPQNYQQQPQPYLKPPQNYKDRRYGTVSV